MVENVLLPISQSNCHLPEGVGSLETQNCLDDPNGPCLRDNSQYALHSYDFRAIQKQEKERVGQKSWLCFGNMFIKMPNDKAVKLLKRGKYFFQIHFVSRRSKYQIQNLYQPIQI